MGLKTVQSSAHLSGRLDMLRSLTNKSLSALTVIRLLLDLTPTFLFMLLNLWILMFGISSMERKYKALWYKRLKLLSGEHVGLSQLIYIAGCKLMTSA